MNYRIEASLAALKNATPGPWDLALTKGFASFSVTDYTKEEIAVIKRWLGSAVESDSNALLIAAAPDLAAEVIRLREEVARLKGEIAVSAGEHPTERIYPYTCGEEAKP